ncbi:hypothetical protein RIF29_09754 [Crotalaria pallida]|uniref:Uncharacterized protein n=1 Tax=Crotalaria pallida TaxID=3830 RepID=A0AAN9FS65_CROPI
MLTSCEEQLTICMQPTSNIIFMVHPEFMVRYGLKMGAHWVCFCPDGEKIRLVFCPNGIKESSVGGSGWAEMKFRYGLEHGSVVHFHYIRGHRFRVEMPGWNGILYPSFVERIQWIEEELAGFEALDEEENGDGSQASEVPTTPKDGGSTSGN